MSQEKPFWEKALEEVQEGHDIGQGSSEDLKKNTMVFDPFKEGDAKSEEESPQKPERIDTVEEDDLISPEKEQEEKKPINISPEKTHPEEQSRNRPREELDELNKHTESYEDNLITPQNEEGKELFKKPKSTDEMKIESDFDPNANLKSENLGELKLDAPNPSINPEVDNNTESERLNEPIDEAEPSIHIQEPMPTLVPEKSVHVAGLEGLKEDNSPRDLEPSEEIKEDPEVVQNEEPEESEEEQERDHEESDERPEPQLDHEDSQDTCDMFDNQAGITVGAPPNQDIEEEPQEEHKDQDDEEDDVDDGDDGDDGDDYETQTNQSFGRNDPGNKVEVSNQDQDIIDFKNSLSLKYESFKRTVIEKYQRIRLEYLKQLDFEIRENERENASSIDFMEQQVEEMTNERDAAIRRASQSRIVLSNVMREKYNTHYLKRACFQSWKYFYEWKKYKDAKSKFCDNYYKKRCLRKIFNGWRKISHDEFLERAFQIRDDYEAQKRKVIYDADAKIDNLMLYLAQLQGKIEEETGLILEIPTEYQIDTGLERIKNETDILRQTDLLEEVRMTQKEVMFKTSYA